MSLTPCNSGKCKGVRAGVKHSHDEDGRMIDEQGRKFLVNGLNRNIQFT